MVEEKDIFPHLYSLQEGPMNCLKFASILSEETGGQALLTEVACCVTVQTRLHLYSGYSMGDRKLAAMAGAILPRRNTKQTLQSPWEFKKILRSRSHLRPIK